MLTGELLEGNGIKIGKLMFFYYLLKVLPFCNCALLVNNFYFLQWLTKCVHGRKLFFVLQTNVNLNFLETAVTDQTSILLNKMYST